MKRRDALRFLACTAAIVPLFNMVFDVTSIAHMTDPCPGEDWPEDCVQYKRRGYLTIKLDEVCIEYAGKKALVRMEDVFEALK